MLPEFGVNGHSPQEFTQKPESSTAELIRRIQNTTDRIQERKPDGVRLRIVNLDLSGAKLDEMEERHVVPSVCETQIAKEGQTIPHIDKAPLNSFQSLGLTIHHPMQIRIDFTATPSEVAALPTELQDYFPQMGSVLFQPMNVALIRPHQEEYSEDFGVVMTPSTLEGDRVGVMFSTDQKCEPAVIGNGTTQLRRLHLTQRMVTMRNNDPVDHEYTRLMTSTGFWVVGILNERLNYC